MMVDKWVPVPPQSTHERALVKKQCDADSPNRAIIENASGKRPMLPSLQSSLTTFFTRPHRFLTSKPFALIFMLYSGTYLTANTLDTLKIDHKQTKPASSTSSGPSKFAATSAANLSLCLYKDSQFTRMFGVATTAASQRIPPASYALFAMRDCLTVFRPPSTSPRYSLHPSRCPKPQNATSPARRRRSSWPPRPSSSSARRCICSAWICITAGPCRCGIGWRR